MAPSSDIDLSSVDYYEFLGIPANASDAEIKRAGRKTSLRFHPDKVEPTPENLEKFHFIQIAIAVLGDPAEKAKYDQSREAKLRRKAEVEALDARRRKMREDLENRESGVNGLMPETVNGTAKRTFSQREMNIKRIAEDNRKKMEAAAAQRRKVAAEQQAKAEEEKRDKVETDAMERSVKVRWVREEGGLDLDEEGITDMFPAGEVENVVMLKDKKRKLDGREKKVMMGTAVIVFVSLATAKRIVAKRRTADFESVEWAAEKEKEPS